MIAVGDPELDVGASLPAQPLPRLLPELLDELDAVNLASQLRQDCSLIAETGADLEDGVIRATMNGCEIVLSKPIGSGMLA